MARASSRDGRCMGDDVAPTSLDEGRGKVVVLELVVVFYLKGLCLSEPVMV